LIMPSLRNYQFFGSLIIEMCIYARREKR